MIGHSNADVALAYEQHGRSMTATAAALGISSATVRRRLRAFHGRVPKPVPRSPVGTRFEHRVRDALTDAGWWVVRAAGSHGAADLVAIRRDGAARRSRVALVQAKRGGVCGVAEWNGLCELADRLGADPVLAAVGASGRGIVWTYLLGPRKPRERQSARSAPWIV